MSKVRQSILAQRETPSVGHVGLTQRRSFRFFRVFGTRIIAIVGISGLALTFGVTPAFADTANATANAVSLSLVPITSGTESATNPGGSPSVVSGDQPALSVLGTQTAITAGVLQQTAVANGDGTSSGCAGLVGNGALIQVGATNVCDLTTTPGETGGVTLGGPAGVGVLTATAIVETCTDSSTGTPTASAQIVDATALAGAISLPVNPNPNTNLLGLGLVYLNTQTVSNGQITATALSIPLIGLKVGTVTCGPNATTAPSSVFPVKSLPIAGGMAVVLGGAGALWYRRHRRNSPAAGQPISG